MAFKLRKVIRFGLIIGLILNLWSTIFSESIPPVKNTSIKNPSTLNFLFESTQDSLILRALDQVYQMNYASADSLLQTLPAIPARTYFQGLVLINAFNDLGDTLALSHAQKIWENFDRDPNHKNFALYRGLIKLQLSYIATVRHHNFKAADLAHDAIKILQPFSQYAEAAAALALYDYYKANLLYGLKWLPFISTATTDKQGPLDLLEKAIPQSHYLREILQTNLLWLYYDGGQYDKGLKIIDEFLHRYPNNRLYRQIKADFLFRKGEINLALKQQLNLRDEYFHLQNLSHFKTALPLGYLSSVGNLAKIYQAQKRFSERDEQLKIWHRQEFEAAKLWLPSSLQKEVKSL